MDNIYRWGFDEKLHLARTVGKVLEDPIYSINEEFISAAEKALEKFPDDWLIHYSLSQQYLIHGYYAEGLLAAKKSVEIRPNDLRSVYLLASAYNVLTRGAWKRYNDKAIKVLNALANDIDKIDKKYSRVGILPAGLAQAAAADQAIHWLKHSLNLNPDPRSQTIINGDLVMLYQQFPSLQR